MAKAILMRSDEATKVDIVDQLHWDTRVDASTVTVTVEDGYVTLAGSVPTYAARQAAVEDAWDVAGVRTVENRITVTYPPRVPMPADTELVTTIRHRSRNRGPPCHRRPLRDQQARRGAHGKDRR